MDPKVSTPWWVVPGLAGMILLIFAGALAASCVIGDTTMRTTMMTGALQLAGVAAGYYLGSSASSQKKDETIAASSAALAASAPVADPSPPGLTAPKLPA